jgi:CelD/BcsL family acetyltransferase involved in cellulose biosynthesis
MRIEVIRQLEQWDAQRAMWEEIDAAGERQTPFQSFAWLTGWWKYAGGGQLHIIRVDDDAGRTIGFAPFFLRKHYYGWPIAHLALIGTKRADYLDFLVRAGCEDAFFGALFSALDQRDRPFAFVDLRDVPERSASLPFLLREAGRRSWFCTMDGRSICVAAPLPPDWRTFLNRLGTRARKDVDYDRRYLARHFLVEVRDCRTAPVARAAFADMVHIYRARWRQAPTAVRFADAAGVYFEQTIYEEEARRDALRFWMLYLDGMPAACVSGFLRGRRIILDTVAHHPTYQKYSVGSVLIGHAIEACIGEALVEFDFTRGPERYKYAWGGEERPNLHIRLCPDHGTTVRVMRAERTYLAAAKSPLLQHIVALYRSTRSVRPHRSRGPRQATDVPVTHVPVHVPVGSQPQMSRGGGSERHETEGGGVEI